MMKSCILFCTLLFFFTSHIAFAQIAPNFGEGVVKIAHYFVMERNVLHPDTANRLFAEYTYYIKGSKVLKKEDAPFLMGKDKSSNMQDGYSFKTVLTAKLIAPTYLLDFQHDSAYTFYTKKNQQMVSVSSINDQRSDIFFRALLSSNRKYNHILEAVPNEKGDTCAVNYRFGIAGKDSIFFQFSLRHYPVESPLSFFFSPGDNPFITVLWAPSPGTGKDGHPISGFSVFVIQEVITEKLPDSLFTISPNAILKKNVSMTEMYDPSIP